MIGRSFLYISLAVLSVVAAYAGPPEPSLEVSERRIVPAQEWLQHNPTDFEAANTLRFSPDKQRYAYVVKVGREELMVVDGNPHISYDAIARGTPAPGTYPAKGHLGPGPLITFSADSRRVAFVAVIGKEVLAVVDGVVGKRYDAIGDGGLWERQQKRGYTLPKYSPGIVFSPNGQRFAYRGQFQDKAMVVVDGQESKIYDGIIADPTFSPDSLHLAFPAVLSGQYFIVVNGQQPSEGYEHVESAVFSPDSRRVAYAASDGSNSFVVVDGKDGRPYDRVRSIIFSPNSRRLAYVAMQFQVEFVVTDGLNGKRYDGVVGPVLFSTDNQRVAYVVRESNKAFVVDAGKEGKRYDEVRNLIFGADGRLAYIAVTRDPHRPSLKEEFVVLDGREQKHYVGVWGLVFSAVGSRYAYGAAKGLSAAEREAFVVVDGKEWKGFADVGAPTFSPEGTWVVYEARPYSDSWVVAIDGSELAHSSDVGSPVRSPIDFHSSNEFSYLMAKRDGTYLIEVTVR